MIRAAAALLIVATVIGVAMPGRPAVEDSGKEAPPAEPWFGGDSSGPTSSAASATADREVRLTRRRDGHFYADVRVNGTNVEFMIDTGATGIAMTADDAKRVGIRLDESNRTYVGEGAGGALTGQIVKLQRVELGPRSSTGMQAAVIDGASTNLLGQSFLAQFPEVTVRGDVMTLR